MRTRVFNRSSDADALSLKTVSGNRQANLTTIEASFAST